MIDATMIEGALILAAGVVGGWVARGRSRAASKPGPPQAATCACKHVRSMHVDGRGHCTEIDVDYRWVGPVGDQEQTRQEYPCSCKIYDGPEPLTSYYSPEISP